MIMRVKLTAKIATMRLSGLLAPIGCLKPVEQIEVITELISRLGVNMSKLVESLFVGLSSISYRK